MQDHTETPSHEDNDKASGSPRREAVLVVNTKSRRGQQLYEEAKRALRAAGFRLTTFPLQDPARLVETVKKRSPRARSSSWWEAATAR
jgi:hypothetical protein